MTGTEQDGMTVESGDGGAAVEESPVLETVAAASPGDREIGLRLERILPGAGGGVPAVIKVGSLDDLEVLEAPIQIQRPDGRVLEVPIRGLTQLELIGLRKAVKWPTAPDKILPVKGGKPVIVKDTEDPEYQNALELASLEYQHRIMVACVQIEIPGNTVEQKITQLERRLGTWAAKALTDALGRVHSVTEVELDDAVKN